MKKLLLIVTTTAALTLSTFAATAANNAMKIGVMNLQEVIQKSPQLSSIKDKLKKEFSGQEKKIQSSQKSLQQDIAKLHKNSSVMKPAQRKALQAKISKEQKALQSMQSDFQQKYMAARNKELSGLFKKVKSVVDNIAKKQKFNLILTNEPVAYASDDMDITDEVIKAMKK